MTINKANKYGIGGLALGLILSQIPRVGAYLAKIKAKVMPASGSDNSNV